MAQPVMWAYPAFHSVEYFTLTQANSLFALEGQPTRVTYSPLYWRWMRRASS